MTSEQIEEAKKLYSKERDALAFEVDVLKSKLKQSEARAEALAVGAVSDEELCKVFEWGVDYGLLIAEQERDSEDLFDAVGCMVYSQKYNVPSTPAPRRKPHSTEWRKAMASGVSNFIDYVKERKVENNECSD